MEWMIPHSSHLLNPWKVCPFLCRVQIDQKVWARKKPREKLARSGHGEVFFAEPIEEGPDPWILLTVPAIVRDQTAFHHWGARGQGEGRKRCQGPGAEEAAAGGNPCGIWVGFWWFLDELSFEHIWIYLMIFEQRVGCYFDGKQKQHCALTRPRLCNRGLGFASVQALLGTVRSGRVENWLRNLWMLQRSHGGSSDVRRTRFIEA